MVLLMKPYWAPLVRLFARTSIGRRLIRPHVPQPVSAVEQRKIMAERQGHLAALVAALDRRDEVIEVVANSPDKASALSGVAQLLGIDESQAQTVLDVQLVRFAVKERDRLREQLESLADWSPDGSAEA